MNDQSVSVRAVGAPAPAGAASPRATLKVMRDVLARRFGIDDPELGEDRELASLGLDSLGFIEYTFELENELHIVLPDVPRDLATVGDFARFVEAEVLRQASPAPAT